MSTYRVSLDAFEGPLDVLLRLIERRELDITQVSLALVTDQYLEHIAGLRELSAANLADFVAIAARLLVIKSRHLLPRPREAQDEDEEEDLGEELVRRLIEYRRYKQVAEELRLAEEAGRRSFARAAPPPQVERRLTPGEVTVAELAAALRRAMELHRPGPPVDEVVPPLVVQMADRIAALRDAVERRHRVRFSSLLRRSRSRLEAIITFLALLELIKEQRVRAVQEEPFGEIYLEHREPDPSPPGDGAAGSDGAGAGAASDGAPV